MMIHMIQYLSFVRFRNFERHPYLFFLFLFNHVQEENILNLSFDVVFFYLWWGGVESIHTIFICENNRNSK